MVQYVTYITDIYITYGNIFTNADVLMYSVKPAMLCVVSLIIIQVVLLMTMGHLYLMHLLVLKTFITYFQYVKLLKYGINMKKYISLLLLLLFE